jgi:hypothetical protein
MTRGPRPLNDHIRTVNAYLNCYQSERDLALRDRYSQSFSCYLLSTCWKKIVRRVKSWQAMGFIHFLSVLVPFADLDLKGNKWDGFPSRIGRGDKSLREFLGRVSLNPETMKTLLLDHISPEYQSQINKPLSEFVSIDNKSLLFSKDSVKEFHCLVIGAFCGFTRAFLRIHDKYSQLVRMDYRALEM